MQDTCCVIFWNKTVNRLQPTNWSHCAHLTLSVVSDFLILYIHFYSCFILNLILKKPDAFESAFSVPDKYCRFLNWNFNRILYIMFWVKSKKEENFNKPETDSRTDCRLTLSS